MKKNSKKNQDHLKQNFDKLNRKIDNLEKTLRREIGFTTSEVKQELKQDFKEGMSKNTSKILDHFDQFIQEIKSSREEREFIGHQLSDHEVRIEKLETVVLHK